MKTPEQLSAELYDVSVPDWAGEMDFYREFAHQTRDRGRPVLEVACGTGRVAFRLAREGVSMVGTDLDEEMLTVARRKSEGVANVGWMQGDMRSLDLGQDFGLILVPGHSFQFMLTPEDQVKALETLKRHLEPGGLLILHLDHQNVAWLGELTGSLGGQFEPVGEWNHPQTGQRIRKSNAWTYERSTQTATVITRWEEIGADRTIRQTWERKPMSLHCAFRFEMDHLLARAGFEHRTLYGDFFKNDLTDVSSEMIWLAVKP